MARVAPIVPAESDLLCEGCGYTLNGLSTDSRCPECGKPIVESIGQRRQPPAWEQLSIERFRAFVRTTCSVIFRPTHFYRTLATRRDDRAARTFAWVHWTIAAVLFGSAAAGHADWYNRIGGGWYRDD